MADYRRAAVNRSRCAAFDTLAVHRRLVHRLRRRDRPDFPRMGLGDDRLGAQVAEHADGTGAATRLKAPAPMPGRRGAPVIELRIPRLNKSGAGTVELFSERELPQSLTGCQLLPATAMAVCARQAAVSGGR